MTKCIPLAFFVLLAVLTFNFISVCRGEEDNSASSKRIFTQEYVLQQTKAGGRWVRIERHVTDKHDVPQETIVCKFYRVAADGSKTLVGTATSGEGFVVDDQIQVDDFLGNGRKQVFVATWVNNTEAKVYDFDGRHVRTVYSTDGTAYNEEDYQARTYLDCLHANNGQAMIQEGFHADGGVYRPGDDKPNGSIWAGKRNMLLRVVRWQSGRWRPIKFRYVEASDEVTFLLHEHARPNHALQRTPSGRSAPAGRR